MTMQYDVKSVSLANGYANTAYAGPTRVKGLVVSYASGGSVNIIDGGSSGTVKFSFTAPAAAGSVNVLIPGEGILCSSNLYANTTNATVVVFHG